MRRNICLVVLILFILSISVFAGCSVPVNQGNPQALHSFQKEHAPSQVVKTENRWVMLNSTYAGIDYTISIGETPELTNTVYTANDVSIWYFEANNQAAVWCEKTDGFNTFKVHVFETQTTDTVAQVATDAGFQPQNVGIFLNVVYYCAIDYAQETVRVLAYDLETKTTTEFYTTTFSEDRQPHTIHLDNEYLSFACSDQVKVFHLESKEVAFVSALPEDTEYVFGVSYDSKNNTCALYYADSDSEDIGILKSGEENIRSIFTFSKNHYAYQDKLECYDGHVYWIAQANVSGNVSDHYTLVDYNYLTHKAVETGRSFDFYRGEDAVYILRFNKDGEYTHIDLCR